MLLLIPSFLSAANLKISGLVTDTLTGLPIANQLMHITSDSSYGLVYDKWTYTDSTGYFYDTIWNNPIDTGVIIVSTMDCNNVLHQQSLPFYHAGATLWCTFVICAPSSSQCISSFTYLLDPGAPLTVSFTDQSLGNLNAWEWYFGDGETSTLQNPVHTYSQAGTYTVSLWVSGVDTACHDVSDQFITLTDSTENCEAWYQWYADPVNTLNVHFLDSSSGNIVSWFWCFGDPASGSMNNSTAQNPTHTFTQPGWYHVCLTIQGADSLCHDTWCDSVYVYPDTLDCSNGFTSQVSDLTVSFVGYMVNNQPASYWWDFGDGTPGVSGQTASHVYLVPGTYNVCLVTVDSTGCTDTTCQPVNVFDSTQFHHVYGQVFSGSFPTETGIVMILGMDSAQTTITYFNLTLLDTNGIYFFTMVPDGYYLILAIPLDSMNYLPTYYGDVTNWTDAEIIVLGTPDNPYNIHLVPSGLLLPGPGFINGQINGYSLTDGQINKIQMFILDSDSQILGFTQVSESGAFQFQNIAYGTYFLHAELAGCTSDLVEVDLTEENPEASVVMTYTGTSIIGIKEMNLLLDAGTLFPNPASQLIRCTVNTEDATSLTAEISDLAGRIVQTSAFLLNEGSQTVVIPVKDLPNGMYTVKLHTRDGLSAARKLVINR